jgi:serine/threonine protein phosphatase 1
MNRLFALSDIHGCFDAFYEMIINTLKLEKSDKLILLGDYIDRGDKSKEVIDFIMDLQKKGFDLVTLAGNHEVMLVDSYLNNELLPLWYMNSGATTLLSFNLGDIAEFEKRYIDFFKNMKFYEIIGNFIFVHAGFNDFAIDPFSDTHGMVWECRKVYNNPVFDDKVIIHGHRPKKLDHVKRMIAEKSKVIPIDTGCVYEKEAGYGNLSALEINTMKLWTVENIYY